MRHLRIVLGPTASGKTDYAAALARKLDSPVISCDSRQIYKEMRIGTAVPPAELLAEIPHYFIQTESVTRMYTAGDYETDAIALLERLFDEGHEELVMCGGSMFYIDAVCNGIPDVPEADPALREQLTERLRREGAQALAEELRSLDPEAYAAIDRNNGMRVLRALEVCLGTGKPFSSFKPAEPRPREFTIEKIGLFRPREELAARIEARTRQMVADGLLDEVRSLNEFRNLTALKTVGYTEVFDYFDRPDEISLEETVCRIATNTRHYAKRQMTWWKRDPSIRWIRL